MQRQNWDPLLLVLVVLLIIAWVLGNFAPALAGYWITDENVVVEFVPNGGFGVNYRVEGDSAVWEGATVEVRNFTARLRIPKAGVDASAIIVPEIGKTGVWSDELSWTAANDDTHVWHKYGAGELV